MSLLPRWVAMCTVLTSRSGSSMQNPLHPLQQAGGQGEEEPLHPGEGKVRRETRRGKRIKSHAPTQPASSLSTWLVYHYCTIMSQYILYLACNSLTPYHSICPWWHEETYPRLPKKTKITIFGVYGALSQSSQQAKTYQISSKTPPKVQN